jgi:hypothetical protein
MGDVEDKISYFDQYNLLLSNKIDLELHVILLENVLLGLRELCLIDYFSVDMCA